MHSVPTPEQFRRASGFLANGITVVTTRLGDVDHAMTANSFTTVSLDPLLVLVCAARDTRFLDAVLQSGQWAVSILDASAHEAAVWFATKGRPLAGQLDRVPHTRGPESGAAVLDSALSVLEVVTTATHDGGDHVIVVGRVVSVAIPSVTRAEATGPLVYYRGGYTSLAGPA